MACTLAYFKGIVYAGKAGTGVEIIGLIQILKGLECNAKELRFD